MNLVGFYQEMDHGYLDAWGGPMPAPESGAGKYSVRDVVTYLRSGYPVLDVMELTTDVIGGDFRVPGGSSVLTDMRFVWREDLAWYVERYRIELPQPLLDRAQEESFRAPSVDPAALLDLSHEVSRVLGFRSIS
ncbi:hypothetical protein [Streptomyces collinus]|uniref:hypothetical protein n=1 Tax=Streptomyces collinus TaxID=42684 RepID=UPI0036F00FF0